MDRQFLRVYNGMFDEIEYSKPAGVYFNTLVQRSSTQLLANNDSSTHLVSMV
jgi:hypothetical protein